MKRGKVMKKKSRFLTGLLSAVMALSLFALPAAAAAENGSDATTKVPTITKSVGSLTINKYEGNEEKTDKLLDGVEPEDTCAAAYGCGCA